MGKASPTRGVLSPVDLAAIVVGLCLGGCYSSGVKRVERSLPTLGMTRDALNVARGEVDTTLESLNELASSEPRDLEACFVRFMGDCESLEAELAYLRRLRSVIRKQRAEFARKRLRTPSLEDTNGDGHAAAMEKLAELASHADAVRDRFNPWFSNLQDIAQRLEDRLDPDVLASLSEEFQKANTDAGPLKERIELLIAEIDEVARVTTVPKGKSSRSRS